MSLRNTIGSADFETTDFAFPQDAVAGLCADVGISAGTMSKLNKGEDVALSVLLRICDYLNCDIGDICEAVRTGKD